MSKVYGYTRVSTREQNEARQIAEMERLGITTKNIFIEKVSGSTFKRMEYNKMKNTLKRGDTLYIESIDRLGRNYDDILNEWQGFIQKRVTLKVITDPMLDTDSEAVNLVDKFIKNITLHVLAFQAEKEHENIKTRQAQGIAVAKSIGKKLGRPVKPIDEAMTQIIREWREGHLSTDEIMRSLTLKKSALYNLARKIEKSKEMR